MLDDRTVKGEGCFFGGVVSPQGCLLAINCDLCYELLPTLGHSSIPRGVVSLKPSSFLFLGRHDCIVLFTIGRDSIGKV